MSKRMTMGLALLSLLLVVPLIKAEAKDEASGKSLKIKDAKVLQVVPEKGVVVVKKKDAVYNIAFGLANPDKVQLLSKYGVVVDPMALIAGDHITCRGRRLPAYFVPSKCRVEKDSQKDLYKEKKGLMVADVYVVDTENKLIVAANSLNKTDLTTIKKDKDTRITYKGDKKSLGSIKPYWRLLIKGKWDSAKKMFKDVTSIKILKKHDTEPKYGF